MMSIKAKCRGLKAYWRFIAVAVALMFFPVVICLINLIPIPRFMPVSIGELLGYYAIVFGLLGTSFAYFETKRERDGKLLKAKIPRLVIECKKQREDESIFKLTIINCGSRDLYDVFVYDDHLLPILKAKEQYSSLIAFDENESRSSGDCLNVASHYDQIDETGYPKEVNLTVFDNDSSWLVSGIRVQNGSQFLYFTNVEPL